jgi:hypothetical protein
MHSRIIKALIFLGIFKARSVTRTLASILDEDIDEIMSVIGQGIGDLRMAMLDVPRLDEKMAATLAFLLPEIGGDRSSIEKSLVDIRKSILEEHDGKDKHFSNRPVMEGSKPRPLHLSLRRVMQPRSPSSRTWVAFARL